ncbi:MAG: beta-N-acetylhexosaminidase [Gammaproteobacteria bacterium]
MTLGPLMLDVAGTVLDAGERELLSHPAVGGIVLFARNYVEPAQLAALVGEIRSLRSPPLLVTVDQEGGRVQRLREGFTVLPPAASVGDLYDRNREAGLELARCVGLVMAAELKALGVDLSLAPVLDLGGRNTNVIGHRALHRDPAAVVALARCQVAGMRSAGMAAVGKHFPGHGSVTEDSHVSSPEDTRALATIRAEDLRVFEHMIASGLPALLPAHVVYSDVDERTACFSRRWLQEILRAELRFEGAILSDDLGCMIGAMSVGDLQARTEAALGAGCDMALLCNAPGEAARVVEKYADAGSELLDERLQPLFGTDGEWQSLRESTIRMAASAAKFRQELLQWPVYRDAVHVIERFNAQADA